MTITIPTLTIATEFDAPDITAKQAEFAAENPELKFLGVSTLAEFLAKIGTVNPEHVTGLEPGDGDYVGSVSCNVSGVAISVRVEAHGYADASKDGSLLLDTMVTTAIGMAIELADDMFGEHRRRHIEEIVTTMVANDPDADVTTIRQDLEMKPLRWLCQEARLYATYDDAFGSLADIMGFDLSIPAETEPERSGFSFTDLFRRR